MHGTAYAYVYSIPMLHHAWHHPVVFVPLTHRPNAPHLRMACAARIDQVMRSQPRKEKHVGTATSEKALRVVSATRVGRVLRVVVEAKKVKHTR